MHLHDPSVPLLRLLAALLCCAVLVAPAARAQEKIVPAGHLFQLTRTFALTEVRKGHELREAQRPAESGDGAILSRSLSIVEVVVQAGISASLTNLQFQLNSATEFATEVADQQLDQVAIELKKEPKTKFLIEGHTCSRGSKETNDRLSAERADFIMVLLISKGVPKDSLRAIGYGATECLKDKVGPDSDEAKLAPYRKVMIYKMTTQ